MLVRTVAWNRSARTSARRRGAVAGWLIVLLPIFVAGFALAVEAANAHQRAVELRNATDAASFAAANALAADGLFSADPLPSASPPVNVVLANAKAAAAEFALRNGFAGAGLTLAPGECVLGKQDNPFARFGNPANAPTLPFTPAFWNLYNPASQVNLVQVAVTRPIAPIVSFEPDLLGVSRTFVDRDVIGFKAVGSQSVPLVCDLFAQGLPFVVNPSAIPVVPLAIRTDYLNVPPNDERSWDAKIIQRNAPNPPDDNFRIVGGLPDNSQGDGIPEIVVHISGETGSSDNGQMVAIPNVNSVAAAISQVISGITAAQLAAHDPLFGELTLDPGHATPDNQLTLRRFTDSDLGGSDFNTLATNLLAIRGQRRVWLLFDQTSNGPDTARIVGFVAARVLEVTNNGSSVDVRLQPTMLITHTAITLARFPADPSQPSQTPPRRTVGPRTIYNPYVARVRQVTE